jgi:hypothetical protein
MNRNTSTILGFLGSLGSIICVIASWILFSWIGIVGRILLYVIGTIVIILAIPDVIDGIREYRRNH